MEFKAKISEIIMHLSFLISLVFFYNYAIAKECPSYQETTRFSTERVNIDDVLFQIHYPNLRSEFKDKVIEILNLEVAKIHKVFASKPKTDVHLIIEGNSAESNGLATVFPYNQIVLNDFKPLGFNYLAKTDDWIKNLVIHEYVHIVTMDMTNGWVDHFRKVFGSSVKTNGILPRWLIEGVAVWYESLEPGQGRLNQAEVRFQVLTALQDPSFCQSIDCLDRPMSYPYGHAPYWIGGAFVEFLEEQKPGALQCFFQAHSDQVPFFLKQVVKECMKEDIFDLYEKFKIDFISQNADLRKFCPYSDGFCEKIKKVNINSNTVDFQAGYCLQNDHLAFIQREEKGSNRFSSPYQLTILELKNSKISKLDFDYPIEMFYEQGRQCVVKQSVLSGCQSEFVIEKIDLETKTKKPIDKIHLNPGFLPKQKDEEKGDYQAYQYLKPEYLLVDYSNFANLSAYNLRTSLIDPLKTNNINIGATVYETPSGENLWAGNIGYLFGKNAYSFSLDHGKFYYYSELIQEVADTTYTSAGINYLHGEGSWKNRTSISFSEQHTQDFISKRNIQTFIFDQSFFKLNNKLTRHEQSMNINYRITGNKSLEPIDTDYLGGEFHLTQSFFKGKLSTFGYNLRHGRFFKDELVSGHIKAGGMNNYLASGYRFPLYMIFFGDLIGNEITTGQMYFNTILFNHYKGHGLLPYYVKDSGIQSGVEYAKGKYLFSANELFKNEYATGIYLKYYVNLTLFYLWDSTLSLVISRMNHPTDSTKLLFLFDATSF